MIIPASGSVTHRFNKIVKELMSAAAVLSNGKSKVVSVKWDPGATNSVIAPGIVKELGLTPIGKTIMQSTSHDVECNKYKVDIFIDKSLIFYDVEVVEMDIDRHRDVGLMIGMDILCHGDFAITHLDGETWFSFRVPSQEHIDYSAPVQ